MIENIQGLPKGELHLVWLRRDLRLHDHRALHEALKTGAPVLLVFVFDENILQELPRKDKRLSFIHYKLRELQKTVRNHGSDILVLHGKPVAIWEKLLSTLEVNTVWCTEDYEPYAIARDKEVQALCKAHNTRYQSVKDQVLFAKGDILKADQTPYVVYTPYSKRWLAKMEEEGVAEFASEASLSGLLDCTIQEIPSLESMGFEEDLPAMAASTLEQSFLEEYHAVRDDMGADATSRLGLHLRFGTVSVRKIIRRSKKSKENTFLKELIWREFFAQILWHFPHTVDSAFREKYNRIPWRNNEQEFERWKRGETGIPLVDAGMKELNTTGFMHNRVRMVVASFLCKHLLIDWRWGERYFAEKLLDFDLSSNVGNWQWAAGSGVDAAPYFRVFNPESQAKKFDPKGKYVQKWLLPTYDTRPIVDLKKGRIRCLEVYKSALSAEE